MGWGRVGSATQLLKCGEGSASAAVVAPAAVHANTGILITNPGLPPLHRDGVQLDNLLHGGGQEGGRRAGTENVLLAVGLGAAAQLAADELPALALHQRRLRDRLQRALQQAFPPELLRVNGPEEESCRLPNTLSIGIAGLSSGSLLVQLKVRAALAGAATEQAVLAGGHGALDVAACAVWPDLLAFAPAIMHSCRKPRCQVLHAWAAALLHPVLRA